MSVSVGDEQCRRWVEALSGDSPIRQAETLRRIASQDAVSGVSAVCVRLAGSRDDDVRLWAAEALERSVRPRVTEVSELASLVRQPADGETAYWAATLLGRLGPDAAGAADALENCLRSSDCLAAREQAAWALSRIGPEAAQAVPSLNLVAGDAPPRLRRLAMQALDAIRGAAA